MASADASTVPDALAGRVATRSDRRVGLGLDRGVLPSRPTLIAVGAALLVLVGQLAEDLADSAPIQMLPPTDGIPRWTVVLLGVYLLVIARIVDGTVRRSLPSLRPAVRIDDEAFAAYELRMRNPGMTVDIALLTASAIVVVILFLVLRTDLPIGDGLTGGPRFLPADALGSIAILAGYAVLGWAGLVVLYATIRLAHTLGDLSREPLTVDVFDTTGLLPFGNIALALALAPAGIIVILLLGLGQPGTLLSWTVLLLATLASVLALLLPLLGVHRQMARAKHAVLSDLDGRLRQVYTDVTETALGTARMGKLTEATNTLVPLRAVVHQMTTWPFRDTISFGRAVLIASAPLVYAALTELIRVSMGR